jgi:predicted nucleotidyltransferase
MGIDDNLIRLPEPAMKVANIEVPKDEIAAFCMKWNVKEFSLFVSVLRDDFRPESDADVLLAFGPGGGQTFENFPELRDELSAMFDGRNVDIVEKRLLRNPYRRHAILTTREVVYAA